MKAFLRKYFSDYNKVLSDFLKVKSNHLCLIKAIGILKAANKTGTTIFLIGNGGSCAIAEHMAIDLTKNAGLRAMTLSSSSMLTTFSNDYGYERVFEKALEHFAKKGDILIAISSSGASQNILNACRKAKDIRMKIITFSGFAKDNPLRSQGDVDLWVDSQAFGYVELIHNLLLHFINDAIIGSAEYMIR